MNKSKTSHEQAMKKSWTGIEQVMNKSWTSHEPVMNKSEQVVNKSMSNSKILFFLIQILMSIFSSIFCISYAISFIIFHSWIHIFHFKKVKQYKMNEMWPQISVSEFWPIEGWVPLGLIYACPASQRQ